MIIPIGAAIVFLILALQVREANRLFRHAYQAIRARGISHAEAYSMSFRLLLSPQGAWLSDLSEPLKEIVTTQGRTWPHSTAPFWRGAKTFVGGFCAIFVINFLYLMVTSR